MSLSVRIKHQFETTAIDVAFEAPKGITMLFGRSGAGKTSVVNSVAGLTQPDEGRISADDTVLYDNETGINLPPHRRRIGYIFQEGRLFPHLTVRQNLTYGRWFAPKTDAGADIEQVVDMLGIGALLDRRPARLSGGEKQRVAIGRALLSNPRLLLADEPLAALDDARKEEILPYFERLRDELDVPILYVSHSSAEVARLATTLVVLDNGRVLRHGDATALLSDPTLTPFGASAAGAVLEARVTAQHDDGITEVATGGQILLLPKVPHPIGAHLRVRIEAQDVMIATEPPKSISALNVLPATVSTLRLGDGPGALVQLQAGENMLLARITRRSARLLDLREGSQVFAVLKAVSVPRKAIGDAQRP